jgi:hypothetical protein
VKIARKEFYATQAPYIMLDNSLTGLSFGDHGNSKTSLGTLQDELLVAPRMKIVTHRPDENEPTNYHQDIRKPLRA